MTKNGIIQTHQVLCWQSYHLIHNNNNSNSNNNNNNSKNNNNNTNNDDDDDDDDDGDDDDDDDNNNNNNNKKKKKKKNSINNNNILYNICWGLRFSIVDSLALPWRDSWWGKHKIRSESKWKFDSLNKDTLSKRCRLYLDPCEQRNETIGGYKYAS